MTLKEIIITVIACIAFIALMGIAGSYDYTQIVIQSMPEEAYYTILDTLGDDATEKAIATEYMNNREFYDNLNK